MLSSCIKELTHEDKSLKDLKDNVNIIKISKDDIGSINDFSVVFKMSEKEYMKMEGTFIDSVLTSTMYFTENKSTWEKINEITVDIKEKDYRLTIYEKVMMSAEKLKKKISLEKVELIENYLNEQPENYFNTLGKDNYINELPLSYFYHMGVLKSVKRAYNQKGTDECGL